MGNIIAMSLRHENHVTTYDKIGVYIPSDLKERLEHLRRVNGTSMTHIVTELLKSFFDGKTKIKMEQPGHISTFKRTK